MPAARPDIPGLPERYEVQKYIARGNFSVVVKAFNNDRNMEVALKVLRPEGTRADVARSMFLREVAALRGVDHPGIVQILSEFECEDGALCIELEFVRGGKSLRDMLEDVRIGRRDRPSALWRVHSAARLCDAVIAAHRRDVVHRDVKPSNVLWDPRDEDRLKLADFGIAAVFPLMVEQAAGVTLRSFFTRPFASPEQLMQRTCTPASDTYSFALLVASLLAVEPLDADFESADLPSFLSSGCEDLRREGASATQVERLVETLGGCLLHEPAQRPSLTEVKAELQRLGDTLRPQPRANLVLTHAAKKKLSAVGYTDVESTLEDINEGLRIEFKRSDKGEAINLYGRSLFFRVAIEDDSPAGERRLPIVDAGQQPGPVHERRRRDASAADVRVVFGRGDCRALVAAAREMDRARTRRSAGEIIELARTIVDVERERLPVFLLRAEVSGGMDTKRVREEQVGRASGYKGAQVERVTVDSGFALKIEEITAIAESDKDNLVKRRRAKKSLGLDDLGVVAVDTDDWYELFDDPSQIDVLDDLGRLVGKAQRYDRGKRLLHVWTDKPRQLGRAGIFFVRNYQKERLLQQQLAAIERLERRETVRGDMAALLSEASANFMDEEPFVDLVQAHLKPKARVQRIVNRMLAADGVFCLQGPPGTGKTTIIAEVIAQLLRLDPATRVLVCAQANEAVANAIERILELRKTEGAGWIVVRDVRDEVAKREGSWSGYRAAYRAFADEVQRRAPTAGVGGAQAASPSGAVSDWLSAIREGRRGTTADHRGLVQVWGTTTARSGHPLRDLTGEGYDVVIIDEAAKATVGEVLVPVVQARKLLLVGDQKQLPPYLENTTEEALKQLGITGETARRSLFEHLFEMLPTAHRDMLLLQFRMHPSIGMVVSQLFYEGRLQNGPGTEDRPIPHGVFDRENRVFWVNVDGKQKRAGETSWENPRERQVIGSILDRLQTDAGRASVKLSVAVIAAYRGQADHLAKELTEVQDRWPRLSIKAATVDSFQGREADVVLYSLVRTGTGERKFLADGRRFNVALSRAKSLLVLVGDMAGAIETEKLAQLIDMIPEENHLEASEFETVELSARRLAEKWRATFSGPATPGRGEK